MLKEACECNLTYQLSICCARDNLLKSSWPVMQLSQAVNLAMVADSEMQPLSQTSIRLRADSSVYFAKTGAKICHK